MYTNEISSLFYEKNYCIKAERNLLKAVLD